MDTFNQILRELIECSFCWDVLVLPLSKPQGWVCSREAQHIIGRCKMTVFEALNVLASLSLNSFAKITKVYSCQVIFRLCICLRNFMSILSAFDQ